MSKQDELKKINAQKKKLNEEAKALRDELNEGKAERIAARKTQAECRKIITTLKADLRKHTASTYNTLSKGDAKEQSTLADDIVETSTALSAAIRQFAEAQEVLDEL